MITIKTNFNLTHFKIFHRYTYSKVFMLSYACSIILLAYAILLAFLSNNSCIAYLVFGVMLPIIVYLYYKISLVLSIQKNKYLNGKTIQNFSFDEEDFLLEQISIYDTLKEYYSYKDIFSIVKYKKYYFIYINRVQAFIINKDNKELDELFFNVKGERFIIRGKKKRLKP